MDKDKVRWLAQIAVTRLAGRPRMGITLMFLATIMAAGSQGQAIGSMPDPIATTGSQKPAANDPAYPAAHHPDTPGKSRHGADRRIAADDSALSVSAAEVGLALPGPGDLREQTLTPEEICLSLNVYWEARNQPFAGQLAVAQVTLNRVHDPRYPNDVCEVVFDHKQFSWFWDGKPDTPAEKTSWDMAIMVASAAMGGSGHAELEGVTHYHAIYTEPYWSFYMTQVAVIGDHAFYLNDGRPSSDALP